MPYKEAKSNRMSIEEVIPQLETLKEYCETEAKNPKSKDNIWTADVEALKTAIYVLKKEEERDRCQYCNGKTPMYAKICKTCWAKKPLVHKLHLIGQMIKADAENHKTNTRN